MIQRNIGIVLCMRSLTSNSVPVTLFFILIAVFVYVCIYVCAIVHELNNLLIPKF